MGLDWIVEAKQENGRTVEPGETAGERPATKSDTEFVEAFRTGYEQNQETNRDPGPPPVVPPDPTGLAAIIDTLSGNAAKRRRINSEALDDWTQAKQSFDYWNRPFDAVLEEYLDDAPSILPRENGDALAKFGGAFSGPYDFRGDTLREDVNDVSLYAGENLGMDFTGPLYMDMTPEEMLEMASDLEKALTAYRASGLEQDQDSIEAVVAAIPWLRFWGSNGHSIVADS